MTSSSPTPSGTDGTAPELPALLERITRGEHLSATEAEGAFRRFMDGSATPAQMAGILVGLRAKGVVPVEVAGGVRALRAAMVPVPTRDPDGLVDTAGTGGGALTTFNVSTAAALVAAGAGVRIAKHGNRSFTSRSGSADVLEALGVKIELSPQRMAEVLEQAGIVFMFAPLLHPAMRHVGPVRRELGVTTVMNLLGPLTNPAGVRRQVLGVSDPALLGLVVHALRELGHSRALVVHGQPGMDEVSPVGSTRVAELAEDDVREYEITPAELGIESLSAEGLRGGLPAENAQLIQRVLSGAERGVARAATVANAAAAIYVAERSGSLAEGMARAEEAVDSGEAARVLEALVEATQQG